MQELHEFSYNNHFLTSFSEKVESRIKDLHHNRQIIIGINSIEEFILSKIKITQFYFDIEDDLREMLQKYKNLFINCKELQEKNHLLANTIRNFEIKNLNSEKIQHDFKQNINHLVAQIGFLKEKQINNEDYISYLEEKVRLMDKNLGTRNNNLMGDFTNREKSRENELRERVNKNQRERNLYNLSYLNSNINNQNESGFGNNRSSNNKFEMNRRNFNLINSDYKEYNQSDKDKNFPKNKGDFVERFLSSYKNKESNEAEKSPIDSIHAGNNLNYENHYNNTAEENRSEANVNNNIKKINFEIAGKLKPISKTIDLEETEKVNN